MRIRMIGYRYWQLNGRGHMRYYQVVELDFKGKTVAVVSDHMDRDEAVAECARLTAAHQNNYAVMPREIGGSK